MKHKVVSNPVIALALLAIGSSVTPSVALPPESLTASQDLVHILQSNIENPTTAFINLDESAISMLDDNKHSRVAASPRDELASEIIDYAKTFLGTPYGRGSKGPRRFDCSGFTGWIFRNFDISLGASSRDQYSDGSKIETEDIKPGDLLFFSGSRGGKTIGHVGMAVEVKPDGDVVFIHASTSQGVTYNNLTSDPYYRSRYIGARRVLNVSNASNTEQ